ncbi:MAG: group 1 truncated hemoglobin [Acidobacteria bacterium]|nr:group 1 truncated hemoglobin [Acidobacteriota bacterium]
MNQQRVKTAILGLFLILWISATGAPFAEAQEKGATLYQRLGGYDAIAALVDDFVGRLAADPQFARFFQGSSKDSRKRRRQLLVEQLCEAAGGPCYYTGRSMKAAHEGLGISERNWDLMLKHLTESFDKFHIRPDERKAVLDIVAGTRGDIVESSDKAEGGTI